MEGGTTPITAGPRGVSRRRPQSPGRDHRWGPNFEGAMTGSFPRTQYVGQSEALDVTLNNTGSKAMPNVSIDLDNYDAWVVSTVQPSGKNLGDGLYSFGPLQRGDEIDVTFTLVPKD